MRLNVCLKELTHWKRLWCWEGMEAGGEVDNRGWDGWMASLTRWMWVWVNSRSWWWTGRPGVLRFMGSQRVGYDWATELNWWFNKFCYILQHHHCQLPCTVFSVYLCYQKIEFDHILMCFEEIWVYVNVLETKISLIFLVDKLLSFLLILYKIVLDWFLCFCENEYHVQ